MENNLAFVKDLIASCFVPELTVDIDNTPIEAGHFDVHRKFVELQLPLLLDFVQQKTDWLCSNEDDEFTVEVKGGFLLLTTEITAHNTLYRIRNDHFLEVLDTFLQKHFHKILDSSHEVEKYVLKHYTQYLKANIWKRHIGIVHGFSRFLQLKVEGGRTLPFNWANFSLSVGLTLRECHLPVYKGLSTTIFQVIISHSDAKEIKDVNIPEVIFDALLSSVRTVESTEDTYAVWECLCNCLDFNEDTDSWDWDMTDEMMENLLGSLKHTSKSDIIICLLYFIPKVLLRFTPNRKQIEEFLVRDYDSLSDDDFQKLRTECSQISSCASYRWALYILKLFVGESHMFMQSAAVCENMLQRFHMCYLTSIFIITVEVMNINLLKFYEQFPNILMEAIATHNGTPRIRELVRQIYNTFIDHLEKSDLEDGTKDFQQYHKAFKQFVKEQC